MRLVEEGAALIDIGGESTRPGADPVPEATELARILPVIKGLMAETAAPLSIDTRNPTVARAAVAAGAGVWNDVSALRHSPDSLAVAAELDCRIVLMHAQGEPKTMQDAPAYGDVVEEVYRFLDERVAAAVRAGVAFNRLIVDPGIGFGKTLAHNLALLANLERFSRIGAPVLVGASRKRFIGALDREAGPGDRLGGSLAAALAAAAHGAAIVRVHDVAETRQAFAVAAAIAGAAKSPH